MASKLKVYVRYIGKGSELTHTFIAGSEDGTTGYAVVAGRHLADRIEIPLEVENVHLASGGHQAAIKEAMLRLDKVFESYGYSRDGEPRSEEMPL